MKICTRCGGEYPEHWFRISRSHSDKSRERFYRRFATRAPVCKGCERTAKDANKRKHRAAFKARTAINRHGKNLADKGIIGNPKELETLYGWDVRIMAHELEHTYSNGCPICHDSFASMVNGYRDLTLDIKDPKQKPWYGSNTQWICLSCNVSKSNRTMEEFGEDQHWWRAWEENQKRMSINPYCALPLFHNYDLPAKGDQLPLMGFGTA